MPVLVRTSLDDYLDNIAKLRRILEDTITSLSWQLIPEMPVEIRTFPLSVEAIAIARSIRTFYMQQLERLLRPLAKESEDARRKAIQQVDELTYREFVKHPLVLHGMLALYRVIYSQRRNEAPLTVDGTRKQFADGILWGPYMSALTIQSLDLVGLTCRYRPVELDRNMLYLLHEVATVKVDNLHVFIEGTDVHVGLVDDPSLSGTMQLEKGLLRVPAPVPHVPEVTTLTIVGGWTYRKYEAIELQTWKSNVGKEVDIVPGLFNNEPCINVLLNGVFFGWIAKQEVPLVAGPMKGVILPGLTDRTLRVRAVKLDE